MKKSQNNNPELKTGDTFETIISSVAFGGEGVIRHEGFVLFVPDVISGEKVRVRITEVKRSFGKAKLEKVIESSPERTEPRCEVYGRCGGCQYQHISYPAQIRLKETQLRETLLRIGGISLDKKCQPIQFSNNPYEYRNSITLELRRGKGKWKFGYWGQDNKTFIPIKKCPIATSKINKSLKDIDEILEDFELPEKIREITIKEEEARVLFFPRYQKPYQFKSKETLKYKDQKINLFYGLNSFFQVNPRLIPNLIQLAREGFQDGPREILFDLYAGSGLFSIALAHQFDQVVGIEVNSEAFNYFQKNIKENRCQNVVPVKGSVEARISDAFHKSKTKKKCVLIDPPREGLAGSVSEFLVKNPVERLVYVSCNPATLARDLKALKEEYTIRKITPLDMFPQTKHLEVVAVLDLRSKI